MGYSIDTAVRTSGPITPSTSIANTARRGAARATYGFASWCSVLEPEAQHPDRRERRAEAGEREQRPGDVVERDAVAEQVAIGVERPAVPSR
jgi:hypothetical protein